MFGLETMEIWQRPWVCWSRIAECAQAVRLCMRSRRQHFRSVDILQEHLMLFLRRTRNSKRSSWIDGKAWFPVNGMKEETEAEISQTPLTKQEERVEKRRFTQRFGRSLVGFYWPTHAWGSLRKPSLRWYLKESFMIHNSHAIHFRYLKSTIYWFLECSQSCATITTI